MQTKVSMADNFGSVVIDFDPERMGELARVTMTQEEAIALMEQIYDYYQDRTERLENTMKGGLTYATSQAVRFKGQLVPLPIAVPGNSYVDVAPISDMCKEYNNGYTCTIDKRHVKSGNPYYWPQHIGSGSAGHVVWVWNV